MLHRPPAGSLVGNLFLASTEDEVSVSVKSPKKGRWQ